MKISHTHDSLCWVGFGFQRPPDTPWSRRAECCHLWDTAVMDPGNELQYQTAETWKWPHLRSLHTASETFIHNKKIRTMFDFMRFRIHKHFDRKGWLIRIKRNDAYENFGLSVQGPLHCKLSMREKVKPTQELRNK